MILRILSFRLVLLLVAIGSLTSCTPVEKTIRKADNFMAVGEYAAAAKLYKRAYAQTPPKEKAQRGKLSWQQAQAYEKYGNIARARGAYINAVRYKYPDSTRHLRLATIEAEMGNPHEALHQVELLLQDTAITDTAIIYAARRHYQNLLATADFQKTTSIYEVQPFPLLNSGRSDYCATYLPPENDEIFFTSTSRKAKGDDFSEITGLKPGDLFYAKLGENKKWSLPQNVETVNTEFDEGACCFNADGTVMYFTVCRTDKQYPRYAEIWTSRRSNAKWSKPSPLKITKDTLSNYAHPAISPEGDFLYFVSDMPGGYGGTDIWRIPLKNGEVEGGAENLGPLVNTKGNEMFPTFRWNGDLYFSSDGRYPNYGGLDIYKVPSHLLRHDTPEADQEYALMMAEWATLHPETLQDTLQVEHLPYPINSSGDDFHLSFEGQKTRGLLSSSRATKGLGWDNIYQFSYPESLFEMKGWVYEQDGYELPAAEVFAVGTDGSYAKMNVRNDGSFTMPLKAGVDYLFLATCEGYLNHRESLRLDTISEHQVHEVQQYTLQFPLASVNHPVLVKGIFYKFDDATIADSSKAALDRLTQLLKENPHVTISLASHTDSRGSDAYNQKLSERRAQSVVRYLIDHGIAPQRLEAIGYGESRPMVVTQKLAEIFPFLHVGDTLTDRCIHALPDSLQETAHALNRRTAFHVLRTNYGLFDEHGKLRLKVVEKTLLQRPSPSDTDAIHRPEDDYIYEE